MDFNQIDEKINQNASANLNCEQLDDKLDNYNLDRLKSIYQKLTGRNPLLLKRAHLCQEIHRLYREWQKNKRDGNQANYHTILNKLLLYLNLSDCSDFKTVTFQVTEPINYQLFDLNENSYYQKCYDELLYRSTSFSQLCADHQSIKPEVYGELFDMYFGAVYENYQNSDRNYLLLLLVGLNFWKYQIIKINYLDSNQSDKKHSNEKYSDWNQMDEMHSDNKHSDEKKRYEKVEIVYHTKLNSLGYFHLTHSPYLNIKSEVTDHFNYSDNWIYHNSMAYRFTIVENPLQNASNEFFQQLL